MKSIQVIKKARKIEEINMSQVFGGRYVQSYMADGDHHDDTCVGFTCSGFHSSASLKLV